MYKYLLEPKAQIEFEESVEYYLQRSEQATLNFINAIEQTITQIRSSPYLNKNKYKNYFEAIVTKFPFTIIYTIEEEINLIVVVSIFHQRRNPRNKYKTKKKK
ncbi:MAG: type II toxin-antitoxin system RelE/ParE family toxin [Chitinophagales bacterium]|nr:type II toxin-antitoxin system RelE/ParE family toxin [Bacteroidota bacterium]